ncbi:MAG: helix-turn-helix domain-containing protein [Halohasta sp.]
MSRFDESVSSSSTRPSVVQDRDLRVVLEIERGGPCFIDNLDGNVLDLDVRVTGETCHTEVTVSESCGDGSRAIDSSQANIDDSPDAERTVTKYHTDEVCSHCPTSVFAAYGCIPHFIREEGQSFFIKTFLPNSAMVSELVSDLTEIGSTVRLVSMTHTGSGEQLSEEIYEVDVSVLTPKQREALQLAIDEDYYATGEKPSMESLADQLDISTSAFSQRLARAEQNVMGQFTQ